MGAAEGRAGVVVSGMSVFSLGGYARSFLRRWLSTVRMNQYDRQVVSAQHRVSLTTQDRPS